MGELGQVSPCPAVPGRVVHVYGLGKLPMTPCAAVVTAALQSPDVPAAVGTNLIDAEVLGSARIHGWSRYQANGLVLYDPLTDEQRKALHAADPQKPWAEWLPYQKGQAGKVDELVKTLEKRIQALESIDSANGKAQAACDATRELAGMRAALEQRLAKLEAGTDSRGRGARKDSRTSDN